MAQQRMTREGFWAIIASCIATSKLRPQESDRIYEHRLQALLFGPKKLDQFRIHLGESMETLRVMMDSIGLDIFDKLDLTQADLRFLSSSIIGNGEAEFGLCVIDPERMRKRAKRGNYSSSFELSIPITFACD